MSCSCLRTGAIPLLINLHPRARAVLGNLPKEHELFHKSFFESRNFFTSMQPSPGAGTYPGKIS
jgi:hypothetical protein